MNDANVSSGLLRAIMATAELLGTDISQEAAMMLSRDLASYSEPQVLEALRRCRHEVRSRLTVAEIIARIDDGRPGPEEAWAMIPREGNQLAERATIVWTEEMCAAWGACYRLLEDGDQVAARMAFLEKYRAAVSAARSDGKPVRWSVSLGADPAGRESAIVEAAARGRLSPPQVERYLGHLGEERLLQLGYLPEPQAPMLLGRD